MTDFPRARVLFSGSQEFTARFAWLLARFSHVDTIGFDQGQRPAGQLESRLRVRAPCLRADHLIDMSLLGQISDAALTRGREIEIHTAACPTPSRLRAICCSSLLLPS